MCNSELSFTYRSSHFPVSMVRQVSFSSTDLLCSFVSPHLHQSFLRSKMEPKKSHFFKVLIGDFKTTLHIPRAFARHVYDNKMPKELTLIPETGRPLKVSVEKRAGDWFLGTEWPVFVRDQKLKLGEFLHFFLINRSTFRVVSFGTDCCSKNIEAFVEVSEDEETTEGEPRAGQPSAARAEATIYNNMTGGVQFMMKDPSFEVRVKPTNNYSVFVPCDVVRKTGLLNKQKTVLIEDPEGHRWQVKVYVNEKNHVWLTSGCCKFFVAQKLVPGDTIKLQFFSDEWTGFRAKIYRRAELRKQPPNCGW